MQANAFPFLALPVALLAGLLLTAAPALAQVPPSGVMIDTSAIFGADMDPNLAGPGGLDFFDDSSVARGQAGLPGDLQSRAKAGGASGVLGLEALSEVRQVSQWTPLGGSPAIPIDIDINLSIDGHLRLADFANANTGDLFTSTSFLVDVITTTGTTTAYDASAVFQNERIPPLNSTLVLTASGDWDVSDFNCVISGGETCSIDVNVTLQDVAFVMMGESFAIDTTLMTEALMFGASEIFGESDFFSTGSFSLSSDTPGVTFAFAPEPDTGLLLAGALLAATVVGRRQIRQRLLGPQG